MFNDGNLTLLAGHVLLEPRRPKVSELLFVPDDDRVPPTMVGRVVKASPDTKMVPGSNVLFVPHGGTLLNVAEGQPDRMVLASDQILGLVED
jgi:hypothetical protein